MNPMRIGFGRIASWHAIGDIGMGPAGVMGDFLDEFDSLGLGGDGQRIGFGQFFEKCKRF